MDESSPTPKFRELEWSSPAVRGATGCDWEEAGLSIDMLAHKVATSPAYLFRLEMGAAANVGSNFSLRPGIAIYQDDIAGPSDPFTGSVIARC